MHGTCEFVLEEMTGCTTRLNLESSEAVFAFPGALLFQVEQTPPGY